MRYLITHTTSYNYSEPASLSQNELFLTPRKTAFQSLIEHQISVLPSPQYRQSRIDYFGNSTDVIMIQHPHAELTVTATSMVDTKSPADPVANQSISWEDMATRLGSKWCPVDFEALPFLFASPLVSTPAEVADYARVSFGPKVSLFSGTMNLMQRIYTEFTYDKTASNVETTVEQVLAARKGVCQDFAHLAISCLRSLGLAARYVSGYLETLPPPGKPKMIGSDASHAWVSVFIPDYGWLDFDPTNNQIAGENHITLAWGRDYGDVAPVKGVIMGGGKHRLSVKVDVSRQENTPLHPGI